MMENKEYNKAMKEFNSNKSVLRIRSFQELNKKICYLDSNFDELFTLLGDPLICNHDSEVKIDKDYQSKLDYNLLITLSSIYRLDQNFQNFRILNERKTESILDKIYDEAFNNEEYIFLKNLRNQILKCNLIDWDVSLDDGKKTSVCIKKNSLKEKIFKGKSKHFLKKQDDLIFIYHLIKDCRINLEGFCKSINDGLFETYNKDVDIYNNLVSKQNLALTGGEFSSADEFRDFFKSLEGNSLF